MAPPKQGFAGYICWNSVAVQEVIPVDAVASSDAVFLATHQPCKILKRPLGDPSGGSPVTEQDVLTTFLAAKTDMLLMPIIGQSGTGKSHLVRWLRARIPDAADRRVIYVPKYGTSLRGVIELILDQMEGEVAAGLRESLRQAADQFSQEEAPTALLDALARTLEFRSRQDTGGTLSADRRWLAGALPVMLRDGVFREHLLRDQGVIQGFVSKALQGTRPGDREEAFAFTVDDFPLSVPDLARANRDAQEVHSALSSDPPLRVLAAEMLTEQLGPAVNDVFGLSGATSLTDVMRRTREVLAVANQELLILIEDFTVLQGIQRELLDALIEPPERDGVKVLCPIRVAMAVTSGYFASLEDTIRTRAGFASDVFVLDLPYASEEGWSRDSVESFVGRYLNASRLGEQRIQGDSKKSSGVSNACHGCPFMQVCHDSFGTSAEGYGLYPFNSAALDRAVRATVQDYFDPRAVLGSVVRFTLDEQRAAIETGEFPGEAFEAKYRQGSHDLRQLSIPVRDELDRLPDSQRYATLLTFWGECPTQLVDLAAGIHEAFGLPLRGGVQPPPHPPPPPPPAGGGAANGALPSSLTANLEALEGWVAGSGELLQTLTRNLRSFLVDAIWTRVEWSDLFFNPGAKELVRKIFDDYSIQIEGSPTRRDSSAKVSIVLARETAVAALFRGIILAQHYGNWRFPDGDRLYRELSNRVDVWAVMLAGAVDEWRYGTGGKGGYIEPRLQALALSARIMRIKGADHDEPVDVLVAALAETPINETQTDKGWGRICARAAKQRDQLREELLAVAGARQGATGRPRAIDPSVLLPIMAEYVNSWDLPSPDVDDTNLYRYVRDLAESMKSDLAFEQSRLKQVLDKLTLYMPAGTSIRSLSELLLRAGDAAADAGVFSPPAELETYREECRQFERLSFSSLEELRALLALDWGANRAAALAGLSNLGLDQLNQLLEFCVGFDRRLEQTLKRADSQLASAGAGSELAGELDMVLGNLGDLLGGRIDK